MSHEDENDGKKSAEHDQGGGKTHVFYNKTKYEFDSDEVAGSVLYQTFQIPAGNKLFLDVAGHGEPDKFIPNDATVIHLKNGQHYYDLPPGTVG